ncbi:MupG family TIM beta-alpha barrel fold protein [Thermoactinomyces sp. CICC 10521]|uniref:MupG family TIM beta-alpha barrel fold protein n=1 Tax=Thermoactinomyces sp. CICC 10521 TaxID=2767426 RepID=UPI0018DC10F5|nr:MupG family TIM beta-alpha barrel fold protein [Thermoactinomyces sp. CICC 10521]MBH8607631.1 DUF871 domain-containing protein [Thermoactinomyces sp. CICC 10521]
MIGVSFYLNDPLAGKRLEEAHSKGVTRAFTSLHIPEESGDLAGRAKMLLQTAKEMGIDVYADVSRSTPQHLGIGRLEELSELGVTGLRLDDYFDHETMVCLAERFQIALNASTLSEADLQRLLDSGIASEQLIAWHNFYPRRETGLDERFFRAQTDRFRQYGIRVAAFVPGRGEKRGPLFEGLPTLEKHRELDPFVAAVELFRDGVDEVYVGDPDAGEGLLEQLVAYAFDRVIPLRIRTSSLAGGEYQLRPDFARDVLRLMDTRSPGPVPPANTTARPRGTVTMDNDKYGRYRGEVQIVLRDLPADPRVNVVGSVFPEDLPLLLLVQPGQRVFLHCHDE